MNHQPAIAIAASVFCGLLFCSCAVTRHHNNQPPPPVYQWQQGTTNYLDRNHDNWIDYEISSRQESHKTINTYKVDTNYDGYYDVEYTADSASGGISWSNNIHEHVPVPGKGFIPVKAEKTP